MSAPENRADIDPAVVALIEQQAELSDVLAGLGDTDWELPSRCDGWSVRDVVLHLAQTNELAIGSLDGSAAAEPARHRGGRSVQAADREFVGLGEAQDDIAHRPAVAP